ncbi:MAG: glucosyl-3-phosphoglycerate synthase, partial [Verrucomicrobia bacterium]
DIKNIRPHFVYGLVGPLVSRPDIKYVKAFYDRPLALGPEVRPSGGGRVTEILVRPLFSLFFPELTAIIQPLSGEYAVRREVLEKIPFPIGYGVETAHLIDVYCRWGLEAFAQTDLDRRVHRNQSIYDLGRMAFGVLQAFISRTRSAGILQETRPLAQVLRQFQVRAGQYELVQHRIVEEERPPMVEVPAYRRKFGLDP